MFSGPHIFFLPLSGNLKPYAMKRYANLSDVYWRAESFEKSPWPCVIWGHFLFQVPKLSTFLPRKALDPWTFYSHACWLENWPKLAWATCHSCVSGGQHTIELTGPATAPKLQAQEICGLPSMFSHENFTENFLRHSRTLQTSSLLYCILTFCWLVSKPMTLILGLLQQKNVSKYQFLYLPREYSSCN